MLFSFLSWNNHKTVYTIRNLGYTLNATGNNDNQSEILYLISRMIYLWNINPPDKSAWHDSINLIDTLAELCITMNANELSTLLNDHKKKL